MNTYELAKITQPTCGSLFKSVMADLLAMACHYLFIFSQQLKVFCQNFSQTKNSFANYSQIRAFGEWRMLSASLDMKINVKVEYTEKNRIKGQDFFYCGIAFEHIFNTLRPRQDGCHFTDAIFTCIFFNENGCILIRFSLKYVRKGSVSAEPMMIISPMHICFTRPEWVNTWELTYWSFCSLA